MGYVNAGVDQVRNNTTDANPESRTRSGGCFCESRRSPRIRRYIACTLSSRMMPSTYAHKYLKSVARLLKREARRVDNEIIYNA